MTSSADNLNAIADWAISLMETLGGPGAGLAIALENLFPPLPSEIILPLAGFTAHQGSLSLASVLIWTTIGSIVGALALYGLGAWLGRRRLYAIAEKMPLIKIEDVERAEGWFARHGSKAIFFGRMIPIFRSLISIPAGIERVPLLRFTLLTTAGSAIWNTIFVMAGYLLGANWHVVEDYAGIFQKIVIGVVAVAVIVWIVLRMRQRRRDREPDPEPALDAS